MKHIAGMFDEMAAMEEFATNKTIAVRGGHALLLPLKCIGGGCVVVTRLAKDVPVGEQSEYTTDRKKKLP